MGKSVVISLYYDTCCPFTYLFYIFIPFPLVNFFNGWEYRLGATPLMELMIAAGKAVPGLQLEHGLAVERVYTGSFMTSLDMAGKFM